MAESPYRSCSKVSKGSIINKSGSGLLTLLIQENLPNKNSQNFYSQKSTCFE